MSSFVPRIAAIALAMLLGSLAGLVLGQYLRMPLLSSLLGGVCAVAVMALIDTLRGYRLINWLRNSHEGQAPRDTGLWGEVGYRVERALRSSERATTAEQTRLSQFLSAIEASPNGVMLLDAGDQISASTPSATAASASPTSCAHRHSWLVSRTTSLPAA